MSSINPTIVLTHPIYYNNKVKSNDNIAEAFLRSALTMQNPFNTTDQVLAWIRAQNRKILVDVRQIPFADIAPEWQFDAEGNLRHRTGKFFSIEGIRVRTNYGNVSEWEQPIINQPEIGYLGIITKEIEGVLYFLLQAKVEPGNVNNVQLSPTLQATKSNYSQVHNGRKPLYLEYFQNAKPEQVLLDQLQSEQGARFLRKRNRNIIIKVDEELPVYDNFIWLTLAQIKALASIDNIVNMDTRTVISGIPLKIEDGVELPDVWCASMLSDEQAMHKLTEILSWLTSLKCQYDLQVTSIPLGQVGHWHTTDEAIEHENGKFFRVIAAQVEINNREVKTWCQPLIAPVQQGLTAFVVKKINGTYHFLVQGKVEPGNFDTVEMAPTVQCITDNYTGKNNQPFVDYVLHVRPEQIKIDTLQSEEGGRFYQEQNRNLIIEADDAFPIDAIPDNYIWVSYQQLMLFLHFNNYLNIQSRSLLSLINFI